MEKTHSNTIFIGAHTSIQGGLFSAVQEAVSLGATTFQCFTANQRQWRSKKTISAEEVNRFKELKEKYSMKFSMSHGSYLINLASPREEIYKKSFIAFQEEILRCQRMGISYLNFHPGASLTTSREQGLDKLISSLIKLAPYLENHSLTLLLEATAGQGTTLGSSFEELGYVIRATHKTLPIGVCLDTCHIFAAGYDIREPEGWGSTLQEFDKRIGLAYLHAFHLNDSLHELGSRKDRHANLGMGKIGKKSFSWLMQDARTRDLPKYLETPNGATYWKEEIAWLKSCYNNNNK